MTTSTDENDFPLCTCGHSSYVHARVCVDGAVTYPCRQVLPVDRIDLQPEPPPCPCRQYRMMK